MRALEDSVDEVGHAQPRVENVEGIADKAAHFGLGGLAIYGRRPTLGDKRGDAGSQTK